MAHIQNDLRLKYICYGLYGYGEWSSYPWLLKDHGPPSPGCPVRGASLWPESGAVNTIKIWKSMVVLMWKVMLSLKFGALPVFQITPYFPGGCHTLKIECRPILKWVALETLNISFSGNSAVFPRFHGGFMVDFHWIGISGQFGCHWTERMNDRNGTGSPQNIHIFE